MLFEGRRFLTTALVMSLVIPWQIAQIGYSAGRPKIAFSSTRDGDSEIYVMDRDGSNQVRLTNDPARDYDPSWSPDGERIVFVSRRNGGVDRVYVMDSGGRNLKGLVVRHLL